MLESSLPHIHTGSSKLGWMESEVFERAMNALFEQGVIKEKISAQDLFTNDYLAAG